MLKKIRKINALKYLEEQSSNAKKFITDRQENYSNNYSRELFESYQSEANTLVEAVKIISSVVYTDDLVRIEEAVANLGEQSMRENDIERMKLLEGILMSSVTEILELDISNIEIDELKLFVGDIEMLFSRLNNYADRGPTPDKIFYQCYGEVNTYLYCLKRLGVFTEEQVRTLKSMLAELERKQASKGYRQVKEHRYKYCPHCGTALN